MMIEGFLLGLIVATSLVASLYFMRFWRRTGDLLFLAFGSAFLMEGLNRLRFLFIAHPSEADPTIYLVRLIAFLLILAAILHKNRRPAG